MNAEDTNPKNSSSVSIAERYRILIEARNFHYSNFNKWMTYFYIATAALFVGYCTIISADRIALMTKPEQYHLELAVLSLGYIVSILWYWSAKGYYYWNINFIELVNYYEETLLGFKEEERVYKIFYDKDKENAYWSPIRGGNFSTSKIAIFFSFIVTVFWGLLIHRIVFREATFVLDHEQLGFILCVLASALITTAFTIIGGKSLFKSNHKEFPELVRILKKKP